MDNSFEVVTLRPGGVVNVLKSGISKKEADSIRDEWQSLLNDAYYPEHCPRVVSRKEHSLEKDDG